MPSAKITPRTNTQRENISDLGRFRSVSDAWVRLETNKTQYELMIFDAQKLKVNGSVDCKKRHNEFENIYLISHH